MRCRGFTILEVCIALALLVTALVAAWAAVAGANRNQRRFWDELAAAELATSVLEEAFTAERCEPTPPEGRPVAVAASPRQAAPLLPPEMQAVLHVQPVAGREDLLELRAKVTWRPANATVGELPSTLERTVTRRARR
jgi:type II secretory pathway pseudopilin PulG